MLFSSTSVDCNSNLLPVEISKARNLWLKEKFVPQKIAPRTLCSTILLTYFQVDFCFTDLVKSRNSQETLKVLCKCLFDVVVDAILYIIFI